MINITSILMTALKDLPYPKSEAPMKEVPKGAYISWQPGAISRKMASGKCFEETQLADVGLVVPDGENYQDIMVLVLQTLKRGDKIRYAHLTDVQYIADIKKRCITMEVCARQEADA